MPEHEIPSTNQIDFSGAAVDVSDDLLAAWAAANPFVDDEDAMYEWHDRQMAKLH